MPATGARARRATNVSLDAALLEEARALDINISRACERGLAAQIAQLRAERWRIENADAVASSNRYVEENGVPLERYRGFDGQIRRLPHQAGRHAGDRLPGRPAERSQHPVRGAVAASNEAPKAAARLNPLFTIAGENWVMVTQFAAAVPCSQLGEPLASLRNDDLAIGNALDMLISGF